MKLVCVCNQWLAWQLALSRDKLDDVQAFSISFWYRHDCKSVVWVQAALQLCTNLGNLCISMTRKMLLLHVWMFPQLPWRKSREIFCTGCSATAHVSIKSVLFCKACNLLLLFCLLFQRPRFFVWFLSTLNQKNLKSYLFWLIKSNSHRAVSTL